MARKTFDICLGPFLKNLKGVIPYYQRQYVWNKKTNSVFNRYN